MSAEPPAQDWRWLGPRHVSSPAEALERIAAICELHPDLPTAAFVVLATHLGLPREVLATALKRYRPELQAFSVADVTSMLNAMLNGGREGLEAVRRTRRTARQTSGGGFPWGSSD